MDILVTRYIATGKYLDNIIRPKLKLGVFAITRPTRSDPPWIGLRFALGLYVARHSLPSPYAISWIRP